ncbi:hypothetical protein Bca52824_025675 [Brassica carinata]|uniref:F-box associated beta-propeller type 1 domain-containing protein n=1 Tax=Brassica carinata TaxID=52824 RepID=A0A8X7V8F2_BRACI|nr:hypothetical protein Bca52824_025675 [Brassica carinata]
MSLKYITARVYCYASRKTTGSCFGTHGKLGGYALNLSPLIIVNWKIDVGGESNNCGVSLKGIAYWFAQDKEAGKRSRFYSVLISQQRFSPRLTLPFESYFEDEVTLSSVGEEQLAVLFQNLHTYEMEVWVTTRIEPDEVSWSKFLAVDMSPLTWFQFFTGGSFLIDEKRVVVVLMEIKMFRKPIVTQLTSLEKMVLQRS